MVDIVAGIVANPLPSLGDQLIALAELGGAGRADFRAGCRFPRGHAIGTHGALLHLGDELPPFIFGDAEGARHHAVAAAHALRGIVGDRSQSGFLQRADGTDGSAGRLGAIHAQAAHEFVAAREHDRHFVGRLDLFGGDGVVVRKFVLTGASLFALLASDANRGII